MLVMGAWRIPFLLVWRFDIIDGVLQCRKRIEIENAFVFAFSIYDACGSGAILVENEHRRDVVDVVFGLQLFALFGLR